MHLLGSWRKKKEKLRAWTFLKATSYYDGQIYFSSQIIIQFLADLIFPSRELFLHDCFLLELIWTSLIWKTNSYLTIHKYSVRAISMCQTSNVYQMLKLILVKRWCHYRFYGAVFWSNTPYAQICIYFYIGFIYLVLHRQLKMQYSA